MNAIIACGGTGGHLFPGIAVAEVLRARGHEVMLFVSEKDVDALVLSEHPEMRYEKLGSAKQDIIFMAFDVDLEDIGGARCA